MSKNRGEYDGRHKTRIVPHKKPKYSSYEEDDDDDLYDEDETEEDEELDA